MKVISGLVIFVALIANINCFILPEPAADGYVILLSEINDDQHTADDHGKLLVRNVRQLSGNITPDSATIGAAGNLYKGNGHIVDGHATATRTWNPSPQTSFGGGLNYQGPHVGASVDANNLRHFGTDVNAAANANIYRSPNGRTTLDTQANYNQHFGGSGGRTKPNFGGGLTFIHRF